MNWVKDLADYIASIFKWWVVVLPWQEGIRVRVGKYEKHLRKGIYLKLPVIDVVYVQNIRLRYVQLPIQTVTTKDNETITILGAIGYQIIDIRKLYNSISNPEATTTGIAMAAISQFIATHDLIDCSPAQLQASLTIDYTQYGLRAEIKITGFASVRTYRLIQDNAWMPVGRENEI